MKHVDNHLYYKLYMQSLDACEWKYTDALLPLNKKWYEDCCATGWMKVHSNAACREILPSGYKLSCTSNCVKLQMYTRCRCTCTRLTSRGWALCVVFLYICIVGLMFPATERTGDKPCRCQEGYTSESPQAAIGKKRHLIPITTTFKSHQGCVLLSLVNIW